MGSLNKVQIIGNLGDDVKLNYTASGEPVANISVATNEKWKGKDGKPAEHTEWHRVNLWGDNAINASKYLSKGSQVYAEGRLRTREWTDREGRKRESKEIQCDKIVYLGGGKGQQQGGAQHREESFTPPQAQPGADDDLPF